MDAAISAIDSFFLIRFHLSFTRWYADLLGPRLRWALEYVCLAMVALSLAFLLQLHFTFVDTHVRFVRISEGCEPRPKSFPNAPKTSAVFVCQTPQLVLTCRSEIQWRNQGMCLKPLVDNLTAPWDILQVQVRAFLPPTAHFAFVLLFLPSLASYPTSSSKVISKELSSRLSAVNTLADESSGLFDAVLHRSLQSGSVRHFSSVVKHFPFCHSITCAKFRVLRFPTASRDPLFFRFGALFKHARLLS